ncbi:MAG: outer membrane lipoprotein-sorting protein, partial [Bacteroidales bacterium]|nr:outer membrane lipoprotein-sorting protein [Bacteroidales bacterium]
MRHFKLISIIIFMLIFGVKISVAQNADSLLQYMDNLMSAPKDKQAIVKIILTNKAGKEKVREAMMKQKGKDKKLYRYTKPESQAGISTLSLPDDIMWLYLPAIGKPTKISLLTKSQAFTGTDFSYEDMESRSYSERYTPTLFESLDPENYILELIPIL